MKNSLIILSIIIVVAIVGFVAYSVTAPPNKSAVVATVNNPLIVQTQKPGTVFIVSSVNLREKGFVVIRKDEGGNPAKIIGISIPLPAGENKNISIYLSEETRDGQTVYAMVHTDSNNNGMFEFPGPDLPVNDASGNIILARVNIAGSIQNEQVANSDSSKTNIVTYDDKGFFPSTIEIPVGKYVTFENISDFDMWIASDPHPSHAALPGFDERTSVKNGGKYSYVFTQTGVWKYHNESDRTKKGEVVVK